MIPRVPFIDLAAQYASLRDELDEAVRRVMRSGMFVLGREVEAFEESFASFVGTRECVCLNSGTAALHLGLMALGLSPGDEVILPANTFFATAEAVIWAGGTPVFADVLEEDATLDPAAVEARITPRTRGIVPVDLYGQPARLEAIEQLAARHGLFVLEDACQAHGAILDGRRAGAFGLAAAFSFYPGKNLGAAGEGGALVTDSPDIARQARMLRDHGQSRKYEHARVGHNFRMDALQGAILATKLPHLPAWNEARRRAADWYEEALAGLPVDRPRQRPGATHVYHLYVVRAEARDALRAHLTREGVESLIHYPVPLHLQPALAHLGGRPGDHPVAERLAARIVSLPLFPEITRDQIARVAGALRGFFGGARTGARA